MRNDGPRLLWTSLPTLVNAGDTLKGFCVKGGGEKKESASRSVHWGCDATEVENEANRRG